MKKIFVLLFSFIATYSYGEVPGYMGKRLIIGYSNDFMLAGIGPTATGETPIGKFGINTIHGFNVEYILKRRSNLCFSVQSTKTGMDSEPVKVSYYNSSTNNIFESVYSYRENPYRPMQIHSISLNFGIKFFHFETLAPVGKYGKLDFLLLFNNLTYKKSSFAFYTQDSQGYIYSPIGKGDYWFKTTGIAYTIGRSRVLFDKLVLDYGLRLAFIPAGAKSYADENDELIGSSANKILSVESIFENSVNARIFRAQFFNVHIGLSFLAL